MLRNKDKGNPAKQLGPMQDDELSLDDLDKVVGGNAPVASERREDEQIAQYEATMALASAEAATDGRTSREDAAPGRGADHLPLPPPDARDAQYSAPATTTPAASVEQPHAPTMFAPPPSHAPVPAQVGTYYPTETGRGDAGSSGDRGDAGTAPTPTQADGGRSPDSQAPAPVQHVADERSALPPAEHYVPPAPAHVAPPAPPPVTEERRGDDSAPTGTTATPDQPAPVQDAREPEPPAAVQPTEPVPGPVIQPVVTPPTDTTPPVTPPTNPTGTTPTGTTPTGTNQPPTGTTPTQPTGTTPTPTEGTGTTPTPTEGTGTTPTPTEGTGTTPNPTEGTGTTPTPTEGTGTTPTPTEGTGTTPTPTEGTGTTPTPTEGTGTTPTPTEGTGTTPNPTEGTGTTPTPTEGTGTTPTPTEGTGTPPSPTDGIISEFAAGHADAEQAAAAMVALYADPSQFGTWVAVRDDLLATLRDLADSDSLTPRQLADLCANLIADGAAVAPQPVPGIPQPDEFVRQTVQYLLGELIYEHHAITAEQAFSALAIVAANEPSTSPIFQTLLDMGNVSPGMVTDTIADAVTSGEITGAQAATVLATMAVKVCGTPYFQPWTDAVSAELRDLVTQSQITVSEFLAASVDYVNAQTWLSVADRAATLAGLADISAAGMTSAVGEQLTALIAEGRFDAGSVIAGLHAAVDSGGLGAATAVALLGGLAARGDAGMEAAVTAELTDLVNVAGLDLTKPQAIEILETFAADAGPAAQAVIDRLVAAISATIVATPETIDAINGLLGPASNWDSWQSIGQQISSRIEAGEISAAQAVEIVRNNVSPYYVTGVLVALAVAGDATVDPAVSDALRVLRAQDGIEARDLVPTLVVAPVAGNGADLNATVAQFIAAGIIQPAEIVNAWATRMNGITTEQNAVGVSVIAGLVERGIISVSEVIDGVKNASPRNDIDLIALAKLSIGGPALLEAAAAGMLSYVDAGLFAPGNLTMTVLQQLPSGQAVALLAELADSGVAGMTRAVATTLTSLVSYGIADAGTVLAGLHEAAASGALGGTQAVAVLGEFAMRSDATVQAAVATELASILGAQHVTREQAAEILEAIAADAAPVHRAALLALVAGLPAPASTGGTGTPPAEDPDTTPNPNVGNGSTPTPPGEGTVPTPTEGTGTTPTPTEGTGTTPTPTEGTGTTPTPTEGTGTTPTPTEGEGSTPQLPAAAAQYIADFTSGARSPEQVSRIFMELMSAGLLNQQDLSTILDAVADGHAGSAEQATALFANLAVDGDGTIRDMVRGPMLELIREHGVTVGQAFSAIAAAADDANVWTQYAVAREIAAFATATSTPADQVADMIGAAIGAHTVSEGAGLGLLAGLAGLDASYKTAVTAEMLDLIQRNDVHPGAVADAIQQAVLELTVTGQDALPMLLAVAGAAPGAQEQAAANMRSLVSQGFATEAQLNAAVADAVAGGVISSESALAMFGNAGSTPTEGTGTTPTPTEGTGTTPTPTEGTGTTPTPTEGTGTTPTPTEGTGTTPTPTEGEGTTETPPAYTPAAGADVDDIISDLAAGNATAEQASVAILALYNNPSLFPSIYEVEEHLAATIQSVVASNTLTGLQAADLLANLAAEGSYNISTAARAPMATLISDGKITVAQAMSALIVAGADEAADGSQYGVTAFIGDVASRFQFSATQVTDLVGAAVASNAVNGAQAAVFLATMAGVVNWIPEYKAACAAEMRDLLAQNELTPAQLTGAIGQVWTNWNLQPTDALQMLLTAAEQSPAVLELVGAEIAAVIAAGGYVNVSQTATDFSDAVQAGLISADHALAILADLGATGTVGDQISDAAFATMAQRGVLSPTALIAYFHDAVTSDAMTADQAIGSLMGLANQNAALLPAVGDEIATLVAAGELTAAQATAAIANAATAQTISTDKAVSILLGMSIEGNAAVDAAVIAELRTMNGLGMVSMWNIASGLLNTPWPAGTDLSATIADLIAADVVQPSTIVHSWTMSTFSQTSSDVDGASAAQVALGLAAIATMVEDGLVTAQQVVDAVKSATPWDSYDVAALTKLAAASPALLDAAAAGMLSYLNSGWAPSDLVWSVQSRCENGYLSGAQAAALLTELAESSVAGMSKAVAGELSNLIAQGRVEAGTVIAGLHDAASGGELSGPQAVALLGELAIRGNAGLQASVAAELATIVGAHHVTNAQATEILQGIAGGATAAQQAVIAELVAGLGSSIDRAQLIFDGIPSNANAAQLDAAADQLAQLVAQGGATAAQVVDDISEALAASRLTPVQAATLLADLAGNGGAVAAAAGAELGDLLSARTISVEDAKTAIRDAVTAGGLTGTQAATLLIAAAADNDSRGLAVNVLYELRGATISIPGFYDTLKAAIADHTVTSTQAFEMLADLGTWYQYSNPALIDGKMAEGLADGTFTAVDVEAAAIHRVIPTSKAVEILAGMIGGSGQAAAIDALTGLTEAGMLPAETLFERVRNAVGAEQNLKVLLGLALSDNAALQTAALTEFAFRLYWSSPEQLDAVLDAAAASNQLAGEDTVLLLARVWGEASGSAAKSMVEQELVEHLRDGQLDLGHLIGALAGDGQVDALALVLGAAAGAPGADAAQVLDHVGDAVAAGTLTADQALAALTALAGKFDPAKVADEVLDLMAAGALTGTDVIGRLSTVTPAAPAIGLLVGLVAQADDPVLRYQAGVGILSQIENGRIGAWDAAVAMAHAASSDNPDMQAAAGAQIARLVEGIKISAAQALQIVHGNAGDGVLATVASMAAAPGSAAMRTAAFDDIAAMVANGQATTAQAILALNAAADAAEPDMLYRGQTADVAAMRAAINAEIGELMNAPGQSPADTIANIHAAVTAHAIDGAQAAGILGGMILTGAPETLSAVADELAALVAGGHLTAAQAVDGVGAAVASRPWMADRGVTVLAHLSTEPGLLAAVGAEAASWVRDGVVAASTLGGAVLGTTFQNVLTNDQAVAMLVAISVNGTAELKADAVGRIAWLVDRGTMTVDQAAAAVGQAATNGHLDAAGVVAVLAALPAGPLGTVTEAVVDAIAAQVTRGSLGAADLSAALSPGGQLDLTLFARVVADCGPVVQAGFGEIAAMLVQSNAMTPAQVVGAIHEAMRVNVLTGEQGLVLLANMSAAVASRPGAADLNQPIHAEIQAMIAGREISDVRAVELLRELSANGSPNLQAAADAELSLLLADQQILINVAGRGTDAEVTAAAHKLADMINQGLVTVQAVLGDILDSRGSGHMTNAQAMEFLTAVVGAGTQDGWAVNTVGSGGASGWLQNIGMVMSHLTFNTDLSPDAATDIISDAVTAGRLTADQAVKMLAGAGTQSTLEAAAAAEIGKLVARGDVSGAQATADVLSAVGPMLLSADQAVRLVAMAAGSAGMTQDAAEEMGAKLAELTRSTVTPSNAMLFIGQALSAGADAAQVGAMLAGYAGQGDTAAQVQAGATIAQMIQLGVLSSATVHAIATALPEDTAVVVLAAMTENIGTRTAALNEIAGMLAEGRISAAHLTDVLHDGAFLDGQGGLTGLQVITVLAAVAPTEAASEASILINAGKLGGGAAISQLAAIGAGASGETQANVAQLIGSMIAAGGLLLESTVASMVQAMSGQPVDGQIALLAAMSDTSNRTAYIAACMGIAQVVANGADPDHVVAEIRETFELRPSEAVEFLAGAASSSPQLLHAAGAEIARMIGMGVISVTNAATAVTAWSGLGYAGADSIAILGAVMGAAGTPAIRDAVMAQAMYHMSYAVQPAEGMQAIANAIEAGTLSAAEGLTMLMRFATAPFNTNGPQRNFEQVNAAGLDALVALLSDGDVSPEQFLRAAGLPVSDSARLLSAASQVFGALIETGHYTNEQVVTGIQNAVDHGALTAGQATVVLATLGDAAQEHATAEIARLIAAGEMTGAEAAANLVQSAMAGTSEMVAAMGDQLGLLVAGGHVTADEAKSALASAVASLSTASAVLLLTHAAGAGDASMQVAAGELIRELQNTVLPNELLRELRAAVTSGVLSAEEAVLTMVGASQIPGDANNSPARIIGELVLDGKISAGAVMTLIHDAVEGGAMTADEALKAIPFVAQGSINDAVRVAAREGVCMLVRDGLVTGSYAVEVLVNHSIRGTAFFQSLIGGEIAALGEAGLVDMASLPVAIAGLRAANGGTYWDASFNVMIGMSMIGPAGEKLVADTMSVMIEQTPGMANSLINAVYEATSAGRVAPANGIAVLVHLAAQGGAAVDTAVLAAYGNLWDQGHRAGLMAVAGEGDAAVQAVVGELLVARGTYDTIRQQLRDAVTGGVLTPDQAIVVMLHAEESSVAGSQGRQGIDDAARWLAGQMEPHAFLDKVLAIAGAGDAGLQVAAGSIIGASRVMSAGEATTEILEKITWTFMADKAMAVIAGMAAQGDGVIDVAIGEVLGRQNAEFGLPLGPVLDPLQALVAQGLVQGADAVRIMAGACNTSATQMKGEIGDAIAELVADGRISAGDAVYAIRSTALTLEQKLDVMANAAVHGDAVLRSAIQTGLWQLASDGPYISPPLVIDVIEALVDVAARGNAALQGIVGTQLGLLATYNSGAVFSAIAADVAAGTMTGAEASAVLSGIAATGNAAGKEAAADALGDLIDQGRVTPAEVVTGISAGLTPDQAIDALVALVLYGNDAVDAAAVAELSAMLASGRVTVNQVTAEVAGLKVAGQIYGNQAVDLLASLAATDYPGMAKAAAQTILDLIPLVERLTPERAREFIEAFGYAEYSAAYMQYNLWYAINELGDGAGGAGGLTVLAHLALLKPDLPELAEECSEAVIKVVGSGRIEITAAIETLTTVAASGLPHAADVVADLISKISYGVEVQQLVGAIGTKALDGTMTAAQALNLLTSMEGNPALVAAAGAQLAMLVEHGVLTGAQVANQIRTMLDTGLASARSHALQDALDGKSESYYDNLVRQEANSVVLRATRMLAGLASSSSEDVQNAAADALMGIEAIGRYTVPYSNNVQLTVGVGGAVSDAYRSGAISAEAMVQVYAELAARGVGSLEGAAADVVRAIQAGDLTVGQMVDVLAESYVDESGAAWQDRVADLLASIVVKGGATIQQVGAEIHEAVGSGALTLNQGIGMLACMADNAVDRGAIGRVLATYIDASSPVGGTIQVMQVIKEVVQAGDLEINAATAMVGGFISGGGDMQMIGLSFPATVLEHWGVPEGSADYNELVMGMQNALAQVGYLAEGRSAATVIDALTAYAEQHDVPVDLLLSVAMHGAGGLTDAAAARTAIANEIREHMYEGSFQNDVAGHVASGHLTMAMAEEMVETVGGGMFGATSVQALAAIDVLHVEVQVATFAEQIMDGEKTAQQAIAAITAAAGTSRYAIDIGLAHLIERLEDVPPLSADFLHPELSGATPQEVAAAQAEHQAAVAAAAAARDEVMETVGARTQTGEAAAAWSAAVNAGVLPAQVAIDQLYDIVGTGRDTEGTYLLTCVGLARLMEASSNDIKNAIKGDMSYLERTLTGLATLISVDPPGFATHQALSFSLATEFVRLGVAATPPEEQTERASALGEQVAGFFSGAWWLMRDANAVANTFGHSIALSAAHAGGAETFESYLSFGAEIAAQGIPGVSTALSMPTLQGAILNMAFTGAVGGEAAVVTTVTMPEWLISGMGNYAPNSFVDGATGVGMSPAMIFTAVNLASKAIPKLIEWFSVSSVLGQNTTGAIVGTCGLVSAACDVVSNSISGMTREAAMNTYRSIVNAGEVYNNIQLIAAGSVFGLPTGGQIADLEHNALQLAQALTPLMYGGADLDAMIAAGVNTAEFTKDLLTGNFSNLEDSAAKMGLAFLDTVIKNHYVQITTEQMYKFISVCGASAEDVWDWYMAKTADPDPRMVEFARGYIGLFTGDTWVALGDKLDSAFSSIGDEVESWFT